jgi:serine phosphatase RsbU (regulator of sigma subunit)
MGFTAMLWHGRSNRSLNLQGEEFGEERLMNVCTSLPTGADAKTICELLSREVAEWATGAEEYDDMTLLGLSVQ